MPKAKEDRRKREVPNFMIDRSTGKQFKWLSPDEKQRVWSAFMAWEDEACKRGANITLPDVDGLSEKESDTLFCMCRDTQEGIDSYWLKYSHPADEQPTVDRRTTEEQPKEKLKEEIKKGTKERVEGPAHIDGFVPPSIDEVRRYALGQRLKDDSEKFVTYYNAHGWRYSDGNPLASWEAAYRIWLLRADDIRTKSLKILPAQDYHQREFHEEEIAEKHGVSDIFKMPGEEFEEKYGAKHE